MRCFREIGISRKMSGDGFGIKKLYSCNRKDIPEIEILLVLV